MSISRLGQGSPKKKKKEIKFSFLMPEPRGISEDAVVVGSWLREVIVVEY